MAKRVVLMALGVVLTLGFWTVKGWFLGEAGATSTHIPARVWEGGKSIVLEVETTGAARVSATFETNLPVDDARHQFLETWERVEPGLHTWTIQVPAGVSGTAEVGVDDPKVGSRARVAVKIDGRTAVEDSQTLTEPLQNGYAFFAQVHLEDYAAGTPGED